MKQDLHVNRANPVNPVTRAPPCKCREGHSSREQSRKPASHDPVHRTSSDSLIDNYASLYADDADLKSRLEHAPRSVAGDQELFVGWDDVGGEA